MSERSTYNQIEQQNHKAMYPTVLVERGPDKSRITPALYEGQNPHGEGYIVSVDGDPDSVKIVSAEQLTDEHQASLAERLAGKPLLGQEMGHVAISATAEVVAHVPKDSETLSAAVDQLLTGLSDEDKRSLHAYSRHISDKRTAQRTGDGQFSILSGQYAGQELRSMSAKAQKVADQYTSLMDKLSSARHREYAESSK